MAGSNTVQSLERGLEILEWVVRADNGVRLGELAERLSLKKTTVHNLVRTLRLRGYLTQDSGARLHPGAALEDLFRQRARRGIYARAEAGMRRLLAAADEATLTFSELAGREICCRLRMSPEYPGVMQRPHLQTFSAYSSASGLCLQAFNPAYREAMSASGGLEESSQRLWPTRSAFDRALKDTMQRGLAVISVKDGVRLAVPVGDTHVLGISLPLRSAVSDPLMALALETAAAITTPDGATRGGH